MGRFVAMLRSINVGGHNRVAMAELRGVVSGLGFDDVATYLQSGNVVFRGNGPASTAGRAIAQSLSADLGVTVPVIVRSDREIRAVLERTPFGHLDADPKLLHVTFLDGRPAADAVRALPAMSDQFGEDRCEVVGKDVYLFCPGGYGETTLNNGWIERKLQCTATTRNWRTVRALADMIGIGTPGP